MKLTDFTIVYINLDKRPEKRQFIESQLKRLGLWKNAHYFPGIDGQTLPKYIQDDYLKRFKTMAKKRERILGRIGCYLSQKCVLHAALQSGVENLLVLEDDCQFLDHHDPLQLPELPKNTDMFYLGGLFWNQTPESPQQIARQSLQPWIRIDRKHLKLACALSYGICGRDNIRRVFETIHRARPSAIDLLYINFIQKNRKDPDKPGNCYVINPVRCVQVNDFESDVTFKGGVNPIKPYKNSYFYTPQQEQQYLLGLKQFN